MKIHVNVAMDDGNISEVRAFMTEESALRGEQEWLQAMELTEEKRREEPVCFPHE